MDAFHQVALLAVEVLAEFADYADQGSSERVMPAQDGLYRRLMIRYDGRKDGISYREPCRDTYICLKSSAAVQRRFQAPRPTRIADHLSLVHAAESTEGTYVRGARSFWHLSFSVPRFYNAQVFQELADILLLQEDLDFAQHMVCTWTN